MARFTTAWSIAAGATRFSFSSPCESNDGMPPMEGIEDAVVCPSDADAQLKNVIAQVIAFRPAEDVPQLNQPFQSRRGYLRDNALRNQRSGYRKTYIALPVDGASGVDGFYTVSMSSVQFQNLPPDLCYTTMPKYPMPTAHMGCLAVAKKQQGRGLGSMLFIHALRRMIQASEVVAARAVEVKAIDEIARDWYVGYGFMPFKDISGPPFHLYLAMDTAKEIVAASV